MRKKTGLMWAAGITVVAAIAIGSYVYINRNNNDANENNQTAEDTSDYFQLEETEDSQDITVYEVNYDKTASLYDAAQSAFIYSELETLKDKGYTLDSPLMAYNPFGTNDCSYYIAFNTDEAVYLEYTIHVDDDSIADYSRTATILSGDTVTKEHEYQLIGFVPGMENEVTLSLYSEDGTLYDEKTITVTTPATDEGNDITIEATTGTSDAELTSGLYAIFTTDTVKSGEGQDVVCYDNNGVLRSVIPISYYRAAALTEVGDDIFYAYSTNKYALVSPLGQVLKTYYTGDYLYHHDYVYNEDLNQIWALGTDQSDEDNYVEDIVFSIDLESGESKLLVDFKDIFPEIAASAVAKTTDQKDGDATVGDTDWIHFNSLTIIDSDNVIFSSRELSAVIKMTNFTSDPEVDYIIADDFIFEGTEGAEYLLTKDGDFASQYGQHDVRYVADDSLPEGSYYLTMYNNNAGWAHSYPDIDWSGLTNVGTGLTSQGNEVYSYYYKYLVNETEGTYELVDSFAVPYSGIMSDAQAVGDNWMVYSAVAHVWGEYDSNGELIVQFGDGRTNYGYRAMKYDFW